jgi:WhiB family redox-sensing transcriptional regulator
MTSVLDPRVRVHYAGQQAPAAVAVQPEEAPARWNWQQDAACRGTDGTFFFPPDRERESARTKRVARAKAVCRECPVIADCRAYALQVGEPFGVWGGLSEEERPQSADRDSKIAELDARSKVPPKRRIPRTAGQRQATRAS